VIATVETVWMQARSLPGLSLQAAGHVPPRRSQRREEHGAGNGGTGAEPSDLWRHDIVDPRDRDRPAPPGSRGYTVAADFAIGGRWHRNEMHPGEGA